MSSEVADCNQMSTYPLTLPFQPCSRTYLGRETHKKCERPSLEYTVHILKYLANAAEFGKQMFIKLVKTDWLQGTQIPTTASPREN